MTFPPPASKAEPPCRRSQPKALRTGSGLRGTARVIPRLNC
jgi:hypothetical protein